MSNDPWGDEPDMDEATPDEAPAATGPSAFGTKLTFKAGKGYEDPWITVFGPSIEAVLEEVKAKTAQLQELMKGTARLAGFFQQQKPGGQPASGGSSAGARSAPARDEKTAQEAPDGEKFCRHGAMEFKSGTSKAGKAYSGYFCTERDKDEQCEPVWPEKRGRR